MCGSPRSIMRGVPSVMRAAVVRAFGGPEVVRVAGNVPVPKLAPDEVLIRVAAASVSPLDTRVRSGYAAALFAPMLPLILGRDVSGTVVALGTNARAFRIGAEVFGALSPVSGRGSHCEFVAAREVHLAPKPTAWTHASAAATPFAALTAWRALVGDCQFRENDKVLVNGLGSTVGNFVAQLAKHAGAAVVAGSVGKRSVERVANELKIGKENLWIYDSSTGQSRGDTSSNIKKQTMLVHAEENNWGAFDVAVDLVGGESSERLLAKLLKKGTGRLATLHGDLARSIGENGILTGTALGSLELARKKTLYRMQHDIGYHWTVMRLDAEAFRAIAKMANEGTLAPPRTKSYKLEHVRHAFQATQSNEFAGKIVLEP